MRTTHNYLFLSDLHLSEGVNPHTGKLDRNEDFFYDLEFAQLLVYHVNEWKKAKGDDPMARPWKLCINGDIWDFLQVVSLPPDDHPIFTKYGVELTDNKREYGLGTSEPETMWKLRRIAEGHPIFFQALGWFLAHEGFEVILLKGNHDTELYWQGVQEVTRHVIGEQYATWYKKMYEGALPDSPFAFRTNMPPKLEHLAQRIQFPPWFYYEPGLFYAEHGNQYDAANAYRNFLHPTVPDRPDLIELPSGSFFVRYFFNKIEILHPFADNLRPLTRYVNWALNSEPLDTLQLVFRNPRTLWKFFTSFTAKKVRQATLKQAVQPAGKDDKNAAPPRRRTAHRFAHLARPLPSRRPKQQPPKLVANRLGGGGTYPCYGDGSAGHSLFCAGFICLFCCRGRGRSHLLLHCRLPQPQVKRCRKLCFALECEPRGATSVEQRGGGAESGRALPHFWPRPLCHLRGTARPPQPPAPLPPMVCQHRQLAPQL